MILSSIPTLSNISYLGKILIYHKFAKIIYSNHGGSHVIPSLVSVDSCHEAISVRLINLIIFQS
jgi:hypothetical protein